jgi:DNA-binding NtrC family response regulator
MAHILIVDDEVDMLTLLAKIIAENTNHNVTTTNNPLEVPKLIKEGAFDLLIVAFEMPGMNGPELIYEVKKIDEYIPILLSVPSKYCLPEDALGPRAYNSIAKPFRKEKILNAIHWELDRENIKDKLDRLKREL